MTIEHFSPGPNCDTVVVNGRLDHRLSPDLESTLNRLMTEGRHNILVDLNGVEYINSGGLRVLAGAWRRARQAGGDLYLSGLNDRVKETIEMVGFNQVFTIFETRLQGERAWTD